MPLFAFYLDAVDQALSENTQQTKWDANFTRRFVALLPTAKSR
jgi:hypothetical protein